MVYFLCKCIKVSLLFISEIPAGVQPGCLSPHTKRSIDLIECVQRRATKLILKSDSNYESRLKELNLNSLEQRRFMGDATFFIKFLRLSLM